MSDNDITSLPGSKPLTGLLKPVTKHDLVLLDMRLSASCIFTKLLMTAQSPQIILHVPCPSQSHPDGKSKALLYHCCQTSRVRCKGTGKTPAAITA